MSELGLQQRTRILIVGIPFLLRELIGEIVARTEDLEVVGELDDRGGVLELAERTGATFVITGLARPEHDAGWKELVRRRPGLRILAVAPYGNESALYELLPHIAPLGELSAETLLSVIRGGHGDAT
jgi:hypothetical protein